MTPEEAHDLRVSALGFALSEADAGVIEQGENSGTRIRAYAQNTDPPINVAAPWCAMFVQYVTDKAAKPQGLANPLDGVKLEAYVESYHEWAKTNNKLVEVPVKGDLALFSFGGQRFDHIGIVLTPPSASGRFTTVEGNTSPGVGATTAEREREGDGVYIKDRTGRGKYAVKFVRWAA